jgi:hypothetical protein
VWEAAREELELAAIAPDVEKLRELDARTRRAWSAYSERLRELTGEEYERVETESWAELQSELRRLERRRRTLSQNST